MKSRRITLIVAVVLAVATGILTLRYLSTLNAANQQQQTAIEMRPVIVASTNIAARTKILPQMLTRVMKPAVTLEPGFIADAKEVTGDVALIAIPQGAPITQSKVGVPAAIGVTGRLKAGQRAVSIPVDMVKSVSGLIEPGDKVDVMASTPAAGGRPPHTASIIRGATVLAVNQTIDPAGDASPPPGGAPPSAPATVTLAVTAAQADLLTVADLNATLRLALRPPDEAIRSVPAETADLSPPVAPAPAAAAAQPPPPAAPASSTAPSAAPARHVDGIPVIDGDKVSVEER